MSEFSQTSLSPEARAEAWNRISEDVLAASEASSILKPPTTGIIGDKAVRDPLIDELIAFLSTEESESQPQAVAAAVRCLRTVCRPQIFSKWTTNKEAVERCAEKGILAILPTLVMVHSKSPAAIKHASALIMVLASDNASNQEAFAAGGMCESLNTAARDCIENASALEFILRACRNLASNSGVATQLIAESIGELILAIDSVQRNDERVSEAVLWLVVNLSCDADAATILGATGICALVIELLVKWSDNSPIVQAGCWALRNLAAVSAFNYSILDSCGAVDVVISLLTKHKEDTKVLEAALWAVANLACDRELSKKLVAGGIVPLLADAGNVILLRERNFESFEDMKNAGGTDEAFLWALRNVSAGSEENNVAFNVHMIQQAAVLLLREHIRDAEMAEIGVGAIANLVYKNEEAAQAMNKLWVCEVVAQATVGHFPEVKVMAIGLKALHFLSAFFGPRLAEIGIPKAAAAGLKAYYENEDVVKYGCEILLNLHYTSESDRARLLSMNAIDEAGKVLKFDSKEAMQEAWIPDDQVKANAWFTMGGDEEEEESSAGAEAKASEVSETAGQEHKS